jgi:hypothetical protein
MPRAHTESPSGTLKKRRLLVSIHHLADLPTSQLDSRRKVSRGCDVGGKHEPQARSRRHWAPTMSSHENPTDSDFHVTDRFAAQYSNSAIVPASPQLRRYRLDAQNTWWTVRLGLITCFDSSVQCCLFKGEAARVQRRSALLRSAR